MYKYLINGNDYKLDESYSSAGKTKTFDSFFENFKVESSARYMNISAAKNLIGIDSDSQKILINVTDPENIILLSNKKCLYRKDWSDKKESIYSAFSAACSIKHKAAALAFFDWYIWNGQNDNWRQPGLDNISDFQFIDGSSNQIDNCIIYEDIPAFLNKVYNPALYEKLLKAYDYYPHYRVSELYIKLDVRDSSISVACQNSIFNKYQKQEVKRRIEENFIDY